MASKIINNGLPEGISNKTLTEGHIVDVKWDDVPDPIPTLITQARTSDKPKTWKGMASYVGIERTGVSNSFDADQIVKVHKKTLNDLMDIVLSM
jgi:hypothetical protein